MARHASQDEKTSRGSVMYQDLGPSLLNPKLRLIVADRSNDQSISQEKCFVNRNLGGLVSIL